MGYPDFEKLMARVVTFGEIMMRLSPPLYTRFTDAKGFEMNYGGGAANVAVSLAKFGINTAHITKLPKNDFGEACVNELRGRGVGTSAIVRGGERMGIYYAEKGAAQRPGRVIYDRKNSSINEISVSELDFDKIFDGAEWFHFTGISPALSQNVLDVLIAVLKETKRRGITVSCDLNYRKKLWTNERAGEVMSNLMQYVTVLISNEEDCESVFGLYASDSDINSGGISVDGYKSLALLLMKAFPSIKSTAFTLRRSYTASWNGWGGLFVDADGEYQSRYYDISVIVDRMGGGDAFAAGLIYGLLSGNGGQYAVEFAAAASCLKHTVQGDFNNVTAMEVETLISGGGSGRVVR
ncbi:MAG: sugar kinase [Christensenellaceae bacterium]|jgi:2-dehydro-3-deoxygluconokinase|nr:sugar kinase [Christensenellaceae bacterium]